VETNYVAAQWTSLAITKMLEKFEYAKPEKIDEECFGVAMCLAEMEYSYFTGSRMTKLEHTIKNIDSTPAYPKRKKWATEREYLKDEGLSGYLHSYRSLRESNYSFRPIWSSFIKDEVLKKDKVEANDLRMIMCTDPFVTRVGAMLDQEQNMRMKEKTCTKEAQVGWSPFYGGLDIRLSRLEEGMEIFGELDWTRFDGTIPSFVLRAARLLRDRFRVMTPEDKKLSDWYTDNLVEKFCLLPGGDIIYVQGGNPSGQFSTSADNCIVNTILTAYETALWIKTQTGTTPLPSQVREAYKSICYGDDRLCAYKRIEANGIEVNFPPDPSFIIEMYRTHFGMWVKPENVKTHQSLAGASFCGMTISVRNGKYIGIYNSAKIKGVVVNPVRRASSPMVLYQKLLSLRLLLHNGEIADIQWLDNMIYNIQLWMDQHHIEYPVLTRTMHDNLWGI